MNPVVHKAPSLAIIYDASRMDVPVAETFTPEYWEAHNALQGEAIGRGSAWFIDAPFGPVVLRQYLRGGWAAKLSHSRYLFTTIERSRPFLEFNVLASLHELKLPVPRPLAALCEHQGVLSSGALMTERIEGAQTLADLLPGATDTQWADVGQCIRRFHQAGVWHADLNARNILFDAQSRVFLLDFDRAWSSPLTSKRKSSSSSSSSKMGSVLAGRSTWSSPLSPAGASCLARCARVPEPAPRRSP